MKDLKRFLVSDLYHACCGDTLVVNAASYDAALSKLAAETLRADTAESELKELREEFHLVSEDLDHAKRNSSAFEDQMGNLQVSNGKLRDRLAAAEQRVSELSADNQQLRKLLNQTLAALNPTAKLAKSIRAALNPKPEAGSHE